MKQFIKKILMNTPLFHPLYAWVSKRRREREVVEWERMGKPVPPPHLVKQKALLRYAGEYGLKILVETGTYKGAMVDAMRPHFERVYSIELSRELHAQAVEKFKGVSNVELVQGDSGTEIKNVLKKIKQPTLFWLDGHYSAGVTAKGEKETPIFEELDHIFATQDLTHVIVIDDARCFGTDPAYPSIPELEAYVRNKRNNVDIVVQDDSIRITPKR